MEYGIVFQFYLFILKTHTRQEKISE